MKYPEYRFVDVALGGADKRNRLVAIDKLKIPKGVPDCYMTVYRYPEDMLKHFRNAKSVSGYRGPCYADYFPIDIDADDLGAAHETAKTALNELLVNYELDLNMLRCYFSGAKGFHILIPATCFGWEPSAELPRVLKRMAERLFVNVRLDPVIYDTVRLFRIPNTKHSKSGLYKVPLSPVELLKLSVEEILKLAEKPRKAPESAPPEAVPALEALYRECLEESSKIPAVPPAAEPPKPREGKLCYAEMLKGVSEGQRMNCAIRLACHFRKQGFPPDVIAGLLFSWNQRNSPPMAEKDIESVVAQSARAEYDWGCNDPVLREFCQEDCFLRKKQEQSNKAPAAAIYSMADAYAAYLEYVKQLNKRKVTLGIPYLDDVMRGIAPGEVCVVMARAGVGKTAFLLNVIRHISVNQQIPILFFTLEQPMAQIYERAVQIVGDVSGKHVERAYREEALSDEADRLTRLALDQFAGLYMVDRDTITQDELRKSLKAAEDTIGQRPQLVCVDYLGRMSGGYGTLYEVVSQLAKAMKSLAKEFDIPVIYIQQTSRAGGKGEEPVTLDMARDSGVIEEAADFIIGLWRPEMSKAHKKPVEELAIALLKNRKGPLCTASLAFKKESLVIGRWEDVAEIRKGGG